MRHSSHSRALHEYQITANGARVVGTLREYRGVLTGVPTLVESCHRDADLTRLESAILWQLQVGESVDLAGLHGVVRSETAELSPALLRLLDKGLIEEFAMDEGTAYKLE
jgi:hypothetical protein